MDIDYDKLWEDIFTVLRQSEDKLPHEKTLADLASQFRIGKTRMQKEVDRLIEMKLITSRKCVSKNGKPCIVYAPVSFENSGHKLIETSEEK